MFKLILNAFWDYHHINNKCWEHDCFVVSPSLCLSLSFCLCMSDSRQNHLYSMLNVTNIDRNRDTGCLDNPLGCCTWQWCNIEKPDPPHIHSTRMQGAYLKLHSFYSAPLTRQCFIPKKVDVNTTSVLFASHFIMLISFFCEKLASERLPFLCAIMILLFFWSCREWVSESWNAKREGQ